jgi:hypothetical protein
MATNMQGTRPSSRAGESPVVETTPTPVSTSTGVGGVAVYDQDVDGTPNSSLRPSASLVEDRAPMETRSSGSILMWIIGVVVLIVLAYFLLQLVF